MPTVPDSNRTRDQRPDLRPGTKDQGPGTRTESQSTDVFCFFFTIALFVRTQTGFYSNLTFFGKIFRKQELFWFSGLSLFLRCHLFCATLSPEAAADNQQTEPESAGLNLPAELFTRVSRQTSFSCSTALRTRGLRWCFHAFNSS